MKTNRAFIIALMGLAIGVLFGCNKKTINPPSHAAIGVSTDTLNYDSTRTEQNLVIYNTGAEILYWQFGTGPAWVTLSVNSGSIYGSNNQIVTLTINRTLLTPGINSGSISLYSSDDSLQIGLLAYQSSRPVLGQLLDSLDFGASLDSMALTIMNTGADTLHWTATISQSQSAFSVLPASGSTTSQTIIWVKFDRSDSSSSLYQATLQVSSDGGSGQVLLTGYIGGAGGLWLSYSPIPSAYYVPDPLDLYFIVRFDRPTDWQNFKVSALRVNLYTLSGAYDDIQFFCWGTVNYQGNLFPDLNYTLDSTTVIDPVSGWNQWIVDWPLNLPTFTVGYYQYDATAPAYPAPWYDTSVLSVRSYRIFQDVNGGIYGDLLSDRNWCLEVFVEPIYTAASLPAHPQGRWIRPSKTEVVSAPPTAEPLHLAREKLN